MEGPVRQSQTGNGAIMETEQTDHTIRPVEHKLWDTQVGSGTLRPIRDADK